jgi:hypothetical protein
VAFAGQRFEWPLRGGALAGPMADATLTPQQAAQALADIGAYEEGLTARVGGLTGMVWGIVSAAIFVTYGVAPKVSPMWLLPFLWVPWTVAGILVTNCAWRLHALSLHGKRMPGARSWTWSLGFAALFVVALLLLHLLGMGDSAFPYMVVVNGIVALTIFVAVGRKQGRLGPIPVLAAGVVMIGGAFVLGALPLSNLGMAFASAALVGVAYVGSGLTAFMRG